jgi:NAD(P)-dependent dehydrogenase (short-subunit alcohol dehydrogenase family)
MIRRLEDTMPKLGNKVALITGSDSGIGQAIAEEFAREGADVAVSFHNDQTGAEATRRQVEARGRRTIVRQLDYAMNLASPLSSMTQRPNLGCRTSW